MKILFSLLLEILTASTIPAKKTQIGPCNAYGHLPSDYNGRVSKTKTGKECQNWPSLRSYAHNYCRNPDGKPEGAWCYTNDEYSEWEYCSCHGLNCWPNWKSKSGKTCKDYARLNWCTEKGDYGSSWKGNYGKFQDHAVNGIDARVCPQCGCGYQRSVAFSVSEIRNQNSFTLPNECVSKEVGRHKLICVATGSSEHSTPWIPRGAFNAAHAVDAIITKANAGFYMSQQEPYPWLRIQFRMPDNSDFTVFPVFVNRVEIYLRGDANMIYEQATYEVKMTEDPSDPGKSITPKPSLVGGQFCGKVKYNGGNKVVIPCVPWVRQMKVKELWIQKTVITSYGVFGPPSHHGYNAIQWNTYTGIAPSENSHYPTTFLAINEVVIY